MQTAPNGFEGWSVGYGSLPAMAEEVTGHGADVLVLDPPELRDRVIERLRAVATTATGAPSRPAGSVEVR